MIFKDKKGETEQIVSLWMFIIWGVVLVGIISSLWMFYSAQGDVGQAEVNIITTKIIECISENGNLREDFVNDFKFSNCDLNEGILESDYYVGVEVYRLYDNTLLTNSKIGDDGLLVLCEGVEKSDVKCRQDYIYLLKGGERVYVKILTASNNQ